MRCRYFVETIDRVVCWCCLIYEAKVEYLSSSAQSVQFYIKIGQVPMIERDDLTS